jgi:ligand-binding sensor domain-containing protein
MLRHSMKLIILLIGCFCLFGFTWQTFTNSGEISSISSDETTIWAATSGGVLRYMPGDEVLTKFTNIDGVGGIDIQSSSYASSYFWFGSTNGKLSRYDPQFREWKQFLFTDRDGTPLSINHIFSDAGFLWISTNIGVSLFDIERNGGEIKETYRRFGDIPAGTGVNSVLLVNDTVWLVTDIGIAYASIFSPNLLDFTNWGSITNDSLSDMIGDFLDIVYHDDAIWVLTESEIAEIVFEPSGVSTGRRVDPENLIYSAVTFGDTLFIGCQSGLLLSFYSTELDTIEIPGLDNAITTINSGDQNRLAVGSQGQGLFIRNGSEWSNPTVNELSRNLVVDVVQADDGKIWLAHDALYVSSFDSTIWNTIAIPENTLLSLEADNVGNVWIGAFGGDVYRINENNQVTIFDRNNSSLIGNSDNPPDGLDFIVLPDMHQDSNGVLWFTCYRGHVRRPVSLYETSTNTWDYYSSTNFNTEAKILSIYSDGKSLWTGFEDDGVYLIDYGDDPFDQSDLTYTHFTRQQSLLPSDNVKVLTADLNGLIWVGTDMGLAYFDSGINRFIRILLPDGIGPQVNSIAFDVRNNMWVATQTGLAFRQSGDNEFISFTTSNSNVVDNNINSLHFDDQLRLWVATNHGLSMLAYEIGAVTDNVDEVFAYPNPFVMTGNDEKVFFNFIDEVKVEIFSLDGSKIKSILSNSGWDGTNESGEKVSSGLYLFHIRDIDGHSHTGKIAVVRK